MTMVTSRKRRSHAVRPKQDWTGERERERAIRPRLIVKLYYTTSLVLKEAKEEEEEEGEESYGHSTLDMAARVATVIYHLTTHPS